MKITVSQLRETIRSAVREARQRPAARHAPACGRRSLREGAEVAAIADAFEELVDMPGWDALGDEGKSALAALEKIRARVRMATNDDL